MLRRTKSLLAHNHQSLYNFHNTYLGAQSCSARFQGSVDGCYALPHAIMMGHYDMGTDWREYGAILDGYLQYYSLLVVSAMMTLDGFIT